MAGYLSDFTQYTLNSSASNTIELVNSTHDGKALHMAKTSGSGGTALILVGSNYNLADVEQKLWIYKYAPGAGWNEGSDLFARFVSNNTFMVLTTERASAAAMTWGIIKYVSGSPTQIATGSVAQSDSTWLQWRWRLKTVAGYDYHQVDTSTDGVAYTARAYFTNAVTAALDDGYVGLGHGIKYSGYIPSTNNAYMDDYNLKSL